MGERERGDGVISLNTLVYVIEEHGHVAENTFFFFI